MNVLKNIFSISTLVALVFSWMANSFIYIHFKVNQDEITEEHCINKDKPELNCDGKCYLKEQLNNTRETADQPQSPSTPRFLEFECDTFISSEMKDLKSTDEEVRHSKIYFSKKLISDPHLRGIDHPPKGFIFS